MPDFPEEPVIVSCDDTRLRRAVTNILSNGVRYARSELCLTCRADKRHVTIRIQDDGDGIAEGDLPHIFDRFYMGKSGKSGIGLALTFAYILFQTVSSSFAINAGWPAALAVWTPNIVYFFIAAWYYHRTPQ